MSNSEFLSSLFQAHVINLNRGKIFYESFPPKPKEFSFSKIEGMLLGVALGDSLGNSSESMLPSKRKTIYGEITDYLPHPYLRDTRGYPSDDTQLTFWTLENLLLNDGLNPHDLASQFCSERIYGIGSTVRKFISNFKSNQRWEYCGPNSAGNGAMMRISPVLLPYLKTGGSGIMVDTALCAMITHNNDLSISACLLHNYILWQLLDLKNNPDSDWWLSQIDCVKDLVTGSDYTVRGGELGGSKVRPWEFIQSNIRRALQENLSTYDAFTIWWSGAYLLETIPCVLYIMIKHGHDPEQSIIRATNDTKDNDTIASIVGALCGALHGKDAFPKRWIDGLTGRTRGDDDGKIFELIEQAKQRWWS